MVVVFILANFFFHSITLANQLDENLERLKNSELVGAYPSFKRVTLADTIVLAVKLKEAQYKISKLAPKTEFQKIEEILTETAYLIDDLFSVTDIFKLNKTSSIIDTYSMNLGKLSKVPKISFGNDNNSPTETSYDWGGDPKENYTYAKDFEKKYSSLNISLTHFYSLKL